MNGHYTSWPLSYKDIKVVNDKQNFIFKHYAELRNLKFLDINKWYPQDPKLFIDAYQKTDEGLKLHAWILFGLIKDRLRKVIAGKKFISLTNTIPSPDWIGEYETATINKFKKDMYKGVQHLNYKPLTTWAVSRPVAKFVSKDALTLTGPKEKYWYLATSPFNQGLI